MNMKVGLLGAALIASATCFATPAVANECYSSASEHALILYSKSQTVSGAYYCVEEEHIGGTVQLKLGKINAKTGGVKVTCTLNPFWPGSLKGAASATLYDDGDGVLYGTLPFTYKGVSGVVQEVDVAIFGEYYEDERGKFVVELFFEGGDDYIEIFSIQTGKMEPEMLWFTAAMDDEVDFGECQEVVAALGEAPIYVSKGTSWKFEKTPTLKYVKHSEGGEVWYELTGLEDEEKPNVCGLKLSYKSKTGEFSGSYYIYLTDEECTEYGKKPTLKKVKVSVKGIVDAWGDGCGSATAKYGKETYTWPVYISPAEEDCTECVD